MCVCVYIYIWIDRDIEAPFIQRRMQIFDDWTVGRRSQPKAGLGMPTTL